jgi:phosphatidylserine/phosphatidylglycerophosphate/cardiolipin synthase-like enzyme
MSTFFENGVSFLFQSRRAGWNANIRSELIKFISEAKHSLHCSIYDLRDPDVIDALKKLRQNGNIDLQIAYDAGKEQKENISADPKPPGTKELLEQAGLGEISTAIHEGGHLMHDKFLVRDGTHLWTGSANFTPGGFDLQDNNCIYMSSPELVANYQKVFEDLLNPDHKSRHKSGDPIVPATPIAVGNMNITAYFTPSGGEDIEKAIISELAGARRVRVLVMVMSDEGILNALLRFRGSEFDIKGVYDSSQMANAKKKSNKDPSLYWFMDDLRFVAAQSHPYKKEVESNFMHNKVLVINNDTVITGSYNLSENAEANDENLLVIKSLGVAAAYTRYFDAIHSHPEFPHVSSAAASS